MFDCYWFNDGPILSLISWLHVNVVSFDFQSHPAKVLNLRFQNVTNGWFHRVAIFYIQAGDQSLQAGCGRLNLIPSTIERYPSQAEWKFLLVALWSISVQKFHSNPIAAEILQCEAKWWSEKTYRHSRESLMAWENPLI